MQLSDSSNFKNLFLKPFFMSVKKKGWFGVYLAKFVTVATWLQPQVFEPKQRQPLLIHCHISSQMLLISSLHSHPSLIPLLPKIRLYIRYRIEIEQIDM